MKKLDYSKNKTPKNYVCSECGSKNCKLWRQYQTFADQIELKCAKCAAKEQKKNISTMGADGRYEGEYGMTDQIGWLVPAVPTEENDTYWGYTSVPDAGCVWWKRLPT